jgi:hypothetical protein
MDDLIATIRQALRGYTHHGARFWPSAAVFMLIALRPDDMTSANATLVCRACVRTVAKTALSVMDMKAGGAYPVHSPGGAVHVCGRAPVYDLVGVADLPFCAGCAECLTHIACTAGCSECRFGECPCRCRTLGHQPTEALICAVCDADLRSSDSEAIAQEVTRAAREGRVICDGCARAIAAQWYGSVYDGMVTHGYAFVSTGAIPTERHDAWELLKITDWSAADTSHPKHRELVALGCYLRYHGPRGSMPGWADIWVRP